MSNLFACRIMEIDYGKSNEPLVVCRFITECMNKLNANALTGATALTLFHKYNKTKPDTSYDPYLMASSCIYVAGKVENEHIRLRDLINVVMTTLRKNSEPLELEDEYYAVREAIVQAELFLLRMINFQTHFEHAHKHLLHYLKSLKEWFSQDVWDKYPIGKTSWSILQDFYHDPQVLVLDKSLISLACIKLALQSYGIAVPYSSGNNKSRSWHLVFHPRATEDAVWEVMAKIMETYTQDLSVIQQHLTCRK